MAPKITVHWLEDSRAQRILWLLEELGLDYEVKRYSRDPKTLLAPKELADVHPLGKSPVVTIVEDGKTLTLAESGAIVEFIVERYGSKLSVPASSSDMQARADYLYWLHWAEGSGMLPLMFSIVFAQLPKQGPWLAKPLLNGVSYGAMGQFVLPRLKENFRFVEQSLADKEYFAGGQLTGADIMMSFIAEGLESSPLPNDKYPNIFRWYNSILEREAYKKALEKGGKNDLGRFTR